MTDLTPEGLRAHASKIVGDYNSDDSPHDGEIMGRYEHRLVSRIAVAFTTLVAEARIAVLQEVNQLACDGLSSSLSIKGMLAMHDRRVVAEARRAQREADAKTADDWREIAAESGDSPSQICRAIAAAIRAQREMP